MRLQPLQQKRIHTRGLWFGPSVHTRFKVLNLPDEWMLRKHFQKISLAMLLTRFNNNCYSNRLKPEAPPNMERGCACFYLIFFHTYIWKGSTPKLLRQTLLTEEMSDHTCFPPLFCQTAPISYLLSIEAALSSITQRSSIIDKPVFCLTLR